jgi:FemAB-related protein (PEP-CTERM system-associated)
VSGAASGLDSEPLSIASGAADEEWNAFVRGSPSGNFFQQTGWLDVLERTFGWRAHRLAARRGADLAGVLALVELRAPLLAPRLTSLPFAVDGGVCAADDEARAALDRAALDLARDRGIAEVELRDSLSAPGFELRQGRYFRFGRLLHATDDENLAAIPPKRRNMIRRAERSGLTYRIGCSGRADLTAFYDLYARTARGFGTPVFPLRFFATLLERLPHDGDLLTVYSGGTPAASALLLFFRDTVVPYYVGARRDRFHLATSDFLYWQAIRHAVRRGARWFDFGRSKLGSGAYEFKRLWGCEPQPLAYRVHSAAGPPSDRSTDDPRLRWVQRIWSKLPLGVTKIVGPPILARYGAFFT